MGKFLCSNDDISRNDAAFMSNVLERKDTKIVLYENKANIFFFYILYVDAWSKVINSSI